MQTVTITVGPPGAGKTTWLAHFRPRALVCSADHFFMKNGVYQFDPTRLSEAHGTCIKKFIEAIQKGAPEIAVDNTNLWVAVRAPYVAIAQAYGAKVEIIRFVDVDPEKAAARNIHKVPLESIKKMASKTEPNPPHWPRETLIQPDWYEKI